MQQLPEYQKIIHNALDELEPYVQKYSAPTSQLEKDVAETLRKKFQEARTHCAERLQCGQPKIMLFGVYNSGKSTLLNALMGEERAEVDDIPKTYQITRYQWQGYELLDTPGINAPIEHEKVSLEALKQCQVVIFVVSTAGSFESKAIFEAMRNVVEQKKHLFIVLNDKEGIGFQNLKIVEIQQAVQRNLINIGFSREKAATFRLCPVNAKYALTGRIEHDEHLVQASGIYELERLAVEEIKRVDGYHIVADLCRYLIHEFTPFIDDLAKLGETDKANQINQLNEFRAARKEYSEFRALLESKAEKECAFMHDAVMNCFPSAEHATAGQPMDSSVIKERINGVYEKYGASINRLFQQEVENYKTRLYEQLKKVLEVPQIDDVAAPQFGDDMARVLDVLQPQQPQAVSPEAISPSDNSIWDKLDATCDILISTPLMGIPSLPKVGLVLKTLLKIGREIFGKSDAELERERIEREAEARRAAEEKYARDIALWRQQLRQCCIDIKEEFLRKVKEEMNKSLDSVFPPLFKRVESEFQDRNIAGKDIITDIGLLQEIIEKLDFSSNKLQPNN